MAVYKTDEDKTRQNLNQVIQDYRENRERLLRIQSSTKEAFSQITEILKPTTAELLECVNIDNIAHIASDLGVINTPNEKTELTAEEFLNKTIYERQDMNQKIDIGNPAIAIVGQVKAGKSTFVNVVLRKNVVCQAFERCTARLTRLTYSSYNYIEILDENGKVLEKKKLNKPAIPKKYLQLSDEDRTKPSEINKMVRAGIKSQFLEYGIDIIDSPGLSENETLTNLSKNMIKSILPIMIYVIDGRTSVKQTDMADLLELKNAVPKLQIIFFITKLDTEDTTETEFSDPIKLAETKLEMAFKKLQYNNFIPTSFKHWSECPYFHGASLYCYMDYYRNKRTEETLFHFDLFSKFEAALNMFLLINFKNKIFEACDSMINFQMDVLTKIITRARVLSDFTKENINHILTIRKIEEELFEKIKAVISSSKNDLIQRLIKRLEDEAEAIINPIADLEYPNSISVPDSGMVMDKKLIEQCQGVIMSSLCQGLENVIKQFVESELYQKYRDAIELQVTSRMKDEIGLLEAKCLGKSPYRMSLERILASNYKFNSLTALSNAEGHNVIMKLMQEILNSIKLFLTKLFGTDQIKESVDVKSREWKTQQAKECLKRCDHSTLAEEVCKSLIDDFENKHNAFLLALENENKFVQKKISVSEEIRTQMAEKAPDFAGLLMLSLDVKGQYMLQGIVENEKIGQGAQGEVFRCTCNGQEMAKKTVNLPMNQLNDIAEEVYYSYLFQHPRLLPLIAVSITDTKEIDSKQISIYAPLMKTDVSKYLKRNKVPIKERLKIALQVAEALQYLHRQQIMHRDLKLANILLDENNNVFLADYGFCKSMALSNHSFVGTPVHIAPEIVRKAIYDYKVDIYSYGMLLWYLAEGTGRHPRFARVQSNIAQVLWASTEHNMRPERLDEISDELWELMQVCWDNEPSVRPDIENVLSRITLILENCN